MMACHVQSERCSCLLGEGEENCTQGSFLQQELEHTRLGGLEKAGPVSHSLWRKSLHYILDLCMEGVYGRLTLKL